jgi:PIN domain nuclease of toxin-antitoxin system
MARLLLDTNIFLHLASDPERVPKKMRDAIDTADERYFSLASSWEIAIKASLGKLDLPVPPKEYVPSRMTQFMLAPLDIKQSHAAAVFDLPFHHRDPFDRLLIAQALVESLTIVTLDKEFKHYQAALLLR